MWRKNQFDKIQEMQGWAWVYLENKVVSNDGDLSHTLFGLYYKLRKIPQSCYRKVTEKLFLDVLKMTRKEIMENIFQNSNRLWKIEANLKRIDGSYSHDTNTENHLEYNKRGKDWC